MEHLETEAVTEERTDCLAFLAACSSVLGASSPEAHRILVTPFHLLLGNTPTSALLSIPPGVPPFQLEATLQTPPANTARTPKPSLRSKWQHHLPDWGEPFTPSESTSKAALDEPPHSKWKEGLPLHKVLTRSHHEAFSRDTKLVQKAREEYYQENRPCFNNENLCDMTDIF